MKIKPSDTDIIRMLTKLSIAPVNVAYSKHCDQLITQEWERLVAVVPNLIIISVTPNKPCVLCLMHTQTGKTKMVFNQI